MEPGLLPKIGGESVKVFHEGTPLSYKLKFYTILSAALVGLIALSQMDEQKGNNTHARQDTAEQQRNAWEGFRSYWPTTLRVDTDMDSFWLNNEERTCQTFPDDKGRVTRVTCSGNASHQEHNIPVKFWGGVDRNTVSDWKCRKEGGNFVCRAID